MTIKTFTFAVAAAALLAGPTLAARTSPQERLDKLLAGYSAQAPVACISQRPSNRSETIPGVGVLYTVGGTRYLNRFTDACPQLDRNSFIVTRTFGTQLCRGDLARVVDQLSRIDYGSCIYANFTPYRRAPQPR